MVAPDHGKREGPSEQAKHATPIVGLALAG